MLIINYINKPKYSVLSIIYLRPLSMLYINFLLTVRIIVTFTDRFQSLSL